MNQRDFKNGKIGVIASDTLYGIMGSALLPEVVEKIYELRGRDRKKPLIVLIGDPADLSLFGISPSPEEKTIMEKYWPGAVTIVLPCALEKFEYLHRGTGTIAFRVPNNEKLLEILKENGPLVAPSANTEGKEPAHTIEEAKNYFGDTVDFYEDSGELTGLPSTLIALENAKIRVLRKGAVEIHEENIS